MTNALMNIYDFLQSIKNRHWVLVASIGIFLLLALIITLIQPLKYQASSRLLIVQDNTSADFYTITKSNQYLGSLLAETVPSGSFYDLVSAANPNINWGYFGGNYKDQIKKWKETITASNSSDTGVVEVDTYHPDAEQARQISIAVDNMLVSQNGLYQNGTNNVKMKIIDQPTVSTYPVKPNILVNLLGALFFGLIFGLVYIYYFPQPRTKKSRADVPAEPVMTPAARSDQPTEQPINYYSSRERIPVQRVGTNNAEPSSYQAAASQEKPTSFNGNIRNIVN
jgi:capsular polysaccharide biosynthesis protein